MNFLLLFSLLFSSVSFAHYDYELIQFENDSYRDFSYQELSAFLGPNAALLSSYRCNGEDEHDPFWSPIRNNPQGNSLRIKGENGDIFIYQQGKPQKRMRDPFVKSVKEALEKLEAISEAAALIRQLQKSYFPITIQKGWNSFNPKEENGRDYFGMKMATALSIFNNGRGADDILPFNNIGVGGVINWNPKLNDPPAYIALAHEMYHAFDAIRGILDQRFVKGEGLEFLALSEFRAVYFENMIRKAFNFPYRTHYGTETEGPGVLDSEGEPIHLPSPCL